ncbi:DUF4214 domain-containing protein [Undibacterium umbellatum]|uniref:DUF4214 domain-containing protein n=1 Tax=Undibacterium umbellatum TaxID=2762300 RepID=A0ABR6ZD61_9BURK|nr:DUF4214 domain-containing protein [Undibacterium umbellatum]MBC3909675.1 DUF4214 domain-containing protein [Undibacterium umbellatum]
MHTAIPEVVSPTEYPAEVSLFASLHSLQPQPLPALTIKAAVDTTPPILKSLSIPASVNLSKGDTPLVITAVASDEGSGVSSVVIELDSFLGHNVKRHGGTLSTFEMDGEDDTWVDGQSSQTYTITMVNQDRVYQVVDVQVFDKAGNVSSYNASQLKAMGVNTFINVTGSIGVIAIDPNVLTLQINGTETNDYLIGTERNESFSTGGGNDIVVASGGNDYFNGGAGLDTLMVSGKMANYAVSADAAANVSIRDTSSLGGRNTLHMVERVQFSDAAIAFDVNGAAGQAYRLYQAAFAHQPDKAGLGYWIKSMDYGVSLNSVAGSFIQSAEFQKLYGSNLDTASFVNQLYQNVLHRAADQAGMDYWSNQLNKGVVTQAVALASFCESVENQAQLIGQIQNGIVYTVWQG